MSATAVPIRVAPGSGLVGRVGDGVLVVADPVVDEQVGPLLAMLTDSCDRRDRPGRLLARRLAQHLFETDPSAVPSFAALAPTEGGWAVVLHGDVELSVVRDGVAEEEVSGRQAATWVDRVVPEGFDRLAVGPDAATLAAPSGHFGLEAGVVPGRGIVMAAGEPTQPPSVRPQPPASTAAAPSGPVDGEVDTVEQSAMPLPSPEEAERQQRPPPAPRPSSTGEAFESVSLLQLEQVPERDPLPVLGEDEAEAPSDAPLVKGVLCQNGHFNHPQARYCSIDGVSMVHRTLTPVQRPRPTLGVLVSDDGSAYSLDRDYLVGREPDGDERAVSGDLTPLHLEDTERSVSRVHAEIRLQDWDVTIADRDSANGTYVAARGETEWRPVVPGRPEVVHSGTRIAFGKRTMTFDSHHQT